MCCSLVTRRGEQGGRDEGAWQCVLGGGAVGGKDRVLEVSTASHRQSHTHTHTHMQGGSPVLRFFWAIADLDSESTVNKSEA